jgi:hypothetical protein
MRAEPKVDASDVASARAFTSRSDLLKDTTGETRLLFPGVGTNDRVGEGSRMTVNIYGIKNCDTMKKAFT